jgi:hypothetical protein
MGVAEMVESLAKVGVMKHLQISGGVEISDSSVRRGGTVGFGDMIMGEDSPGGVECIQYMLPCSFSCAYNTHHDIPPLS